MAIAEDQQELIDQFQDFYRSYYRKSIGDLAQGFPTDQRSLYIDWNDLFQYDSDLADDVLDQPAQVKDYAEEALRLYDLPVDVSLGQAHVRFHNLPDRTEIRAIRAKHVNNLVAVRGIVRKATGVRPKIREAAFECQRCGTLTRIPQNGSEFQEPHECEGCDRQGPFSVNFDQSDFIDAQKIRIQESPEGLRGGQTPESIDVSVEDDIAGEVDPGDHIVANGILRLEQQGNQQEKSQVFDVFMDGISIEIEDEEFEEMDITDEDKHEIVELADQPNLFDALVDSIAPTIYGYPTEKRAMALQLFSGVTKSLPDGSRVRGDMHVLLIGDPGTGKCVRGDTRIRLADGREAEIRDLVEDNLTDPIPVDDGVYDFADFAVPSMGPDGSIRDQRVSKVWKRESPDSMLTITTTRGREIEVTPSHPLFVLNKSSIKPTAAENLLEGEFIAVPTQIETDDVCTLDVEYRRSRANNAVRLDLPDKWTPSLARLIGFIIAEGSVNIGENWCADVRVTNQDEEIIEDVSNAFEKVGLPATIDQRGKRSKRVICTSSEFVSFLENLEPAITKRSAAQRVPKPLFTASKSIQKEFLKAYIDAEGHISAKERELVVASMSKELLEGIRSLLRGLGIHASIHPRKNESYRLRISGNDFSEYIEEIGLFTQRKRKSSTKFDDVQHNTNTDVVPIAPTVLRKIRTALALSQSECGLPRSTYQNYETGSRYPSKASFAAIVDRFKARLETLKVYQSQVKDGRWDPIPEIRRTLGLSQEELSAGMDVSQTAVSYFKRNTVLPDGGAIAGAIDVFEGQLEACLQVEEEIEQLESLLESNVRWEKITSIDKSESSHEWVYDLEVAGTHNYISNGIVSHNSQLLQYIKNIAPRSVYTSGKGSSSAGLTAAAVRDDFGEGGQWSLEAGALVLADRGVAAIDELDKMRPEDQSAMHQALEQQEISISKAGINATLKSRCSLLGAANPTYGRFDEYEPIAEQIDLEPPLISRFDLIFTVTDKPDKEKDRRLAEHILQTNYTGEMFTQRQELATSNFDDATIEEASRSVEPAINPELLRKYVAYAKRNCFPTMTQVARDSIRDFYIDLRSRGEGEDQPVPVTARKLEAMIRLAEASARIRLSDTVEREDADRAIDIIESSLRDIGVDPETGQFDADVIETGTSKNQRDRIRTVRNIIADLENEYDEGAPIDAVIEAASDQDLEPEKTKHEIEKLKRKGEVYEPSTDVLRTT